MFRSSQLRSKIASQRAQNPQIKAKIWNIACKIEDFLTQVKFPTSNQCHYASLSLALVLLWNVQKSIPIRREMERLIQFLDVLYWVHTILTISPVGTVLQNSRIPIKF